MELVNVRRFHLRFRSVEPTTVVSGKTHFVDRSFVLCSVFSELFGAAREAGDGKTEAGPKGSESLETFNLSWNDSKE